MSLINVDPKYNPNFVGNITSRTKLSPGISVSKFTGAPGSRTRIERVPSQDRPQIARNLYMHAEAMRAINENQTQFKDVSVVVSEGLYKPFSPSGAITQTGLTNRDFLSHIAPLFKEETVPEGVDENGIPHVTAAKQLGNAIVYEVLGKNGRVSLEKTFEVAEFWKDNVQYDWILLEYDNFDPNGSLHSQIVLIMPEIPYTWEVTFTRQIATFYNYHLQSINEFVEMREKYDIVDPVVATGLQDNVPEPPQSEPPPQIEQTAVLNTQTATVDEILNERLTGFNTSRAKAKEKCEEYVGRELTDREFDALVRAAYAKASSNSEEQAYVAGVILNRARVGYNGSNNVVDVLLQRNQFPDVTGTRANGRLPSGKFAQDISGTGSLKDVYVNIEKYLGSADTSWMNFTPANSSDYGPGTDVGFLDRMIDAGGRRVGDTVFGTV